MKKRALQYMLSGECPLCHGKRLRRESLAVTFAGLDITEISRAAAGQPGGHPRARTRRGRPRGMDRLAAEHPEKWLVVRRIAQDLGGRLAVLIDLGLGYLSLERSTPTLSPGELQRLRLATQVRSNLFGVVYVLDEPSAGLHPADTEALLRALDRLKASGNSLFVVEHDLDVIRHADWIVDVGPAAGEQGGLVLYSGPPEGLRDVEASQTRRHLFEIGLAPRTDAAGAEGLAPPGRRHAQQPAPTGRRLPPGRVHERDRRLGLGQVEPGEPGPGRAGRGEARPSPPGGRGGRLGAGAAGCRPPSTAGSRPGWRASSAW